MSFERNTLVEKGGKVAPCIFIYLHLLNQQQNATNITNISLLTKALPFSADNKNFITEATLEIFANLGN